MKLRDKLIIAGVSLVGVSVVTGILILQHSIKDLLSEELDMDFGYDPVTRLDEDHHH